MNRVWQFIGLLIVAAGFCILFATFISIDPTYSFTQGLVLSPLLLAGSLFGGWVLSIRLRLKRYMKQIMTGCMVLALAVTLMIALQA